MPKNKFFSLILIASFFSACVPSQQIVQTAIAKTQSAWSPTPVPTLTPTITTISPTATQLPTFTATTIPVTATDTLSSGGQQFAWNYVASQDSGGVTVQIARVLIADKNAVNADFTNGGLATVFDNKPVVAELVFIVTNTTAKTISIYPDQGKVVAGNEQIDLTDFSMAGAEFGENISGEILPGVKAIGGVWFGFKRTSVADIQKMTIVFSGPSDASFQRLGPDFSFAIDLSNRKNDPMPDELK